ncbi:hypothetical protein CPB86DRAFT_90017 [Serendipita vermifera]|nr:hypothetical protein CPB86DRAFT_90017 [Serendipita vermifera]
MYCLGPRMAKAPLDALRFPWPRALDENITRKLEKGVSWLRRVDQSLFFFITTSNLCRPVTLSAIQTSEYGSACVMILKSRRSEAPKVYRRIFIFHKTIVHVDFTRRPLLISSDEHEETMPPPRRFDRLSTDARISRSNFVIKILVISTKNIYTLYPACMIISLRPAQRAVREHSSR